MQEPRSQEHEREGGTYAQVVGWPDRTVVFYAAVGDVPDGVVAAFTEAGFVPVVVGPASAERAGRELDPFVFLVLDADLLAAPEAEQVVPALLARSPHARVVLLTHGVTPPQAWQRAIRLGAVAVVDREQAERLHEVIRDQLAAAGAGRERVLAIGAHPDDVELGAGGTLLHHRRAGDRVTILTLSHGAVGGERLRRRDEATSAALALGAQLLLADLTDTHIRHDGSTVALIEEVVRATDPTVVFVHSLHDRHQDHREVHLAAMSALRATPHVYAYQSPSATNAFNPSMFSEIDDVITDKISLLGHFVSQAARHYLEPDAVSSTARYWSRQTGPGNLYAEPFEVVRSTVWSGGRGLGRPLVRSDRLSRSILGASA